MLARSPVLAHVQSRERRYGRGRARRRRDFFALGLVLLLTVGCGVAVHVAAPVAAGLGQARITAVTLEKQPRSLPAAAPASGAISAATVHAVLGAPAYDLTAYDPARIPDLGLHAKAALLVDLDSQRVLWAKDPHARRAPASLTKLMTAMVALDVAGPDRRVTVTGEAASAEPSRMGLTAGETLTVRELLSGALLDSGNDAAAALADGVEPLDRFLYDMNRKAAALGMRDTHFATPNGLDDPNLYSSPYDLAVMAGYVLKQYPEIVRIASTRDIVIPATDDHKAFFPHNRNQFLRVYTGATGLKTGFTDDAGGCLIATASRGGRSLLLVLMGSDIMFGDGVRLMDFGFTT